MSRDFNSYNKRAVAEWTKQDQKIWLGVQKSNASAVQSGLKKGGDPAKLNPQGELSSLHLAARKGNSAMVALIVEQAHLLDLNHRDLKGRTPLHLAVSMGHHDVARHLINKHADLMAEDTEQMSLMHSAVMGGYINCVLLLIDKGAPNDWPDKNGFTPLHYAAKKNQATFCSLLLKNGASVDSRDKTGTTPLMLSAQNSNSSLCSFLLGKGADKALKDKEGHDALWHANDKHHTAVVKVLDDSKAETRLQGSSFLSDNFSSNQGSIEPSNNLKKKLTNQIDELVKCASAFELSYKDKEGEAFRKSMDSLQEQVNKLKSAITLNEDWSEDEEEDEEQTNRKDAFNRKYANSYRKLKNQVEFKDSEDLVNCISESLLHVQVLDKENEELQEKVKDLESRLEAQRKKSFSGQPEHTFNVDSCADVMVRNELLQEENKHIKKLLSEHISDLAIMQRAQSNFYNVPSDPEYEILIKEGDASSLELKAFKNHVRSYMELENEYKESLAVIEVLKEQLAKHNIEHNFSELSTNDQWQRLTNSYRNNLQENFNILLDNYNSSLKGPENSNEQFLPLTSANNSNSYFPPIKLETSSKEKNEKIYKNSDSIDHQNVYLQPHTVSESFENVLLQRDILKQESADLKAIIESLRNEQQGKLDQNEYIEMGVKGKKSASPAVSNAKEKSSENESLKREIEMLRRDLKNHQQSKEVLNLLQDHYIQYFTDPTSSTSSVVPQELKLLVEKLIENNESLMNTLKEENELKSEITKELSNSKLKIASLEQSTDSFGVMAVEKDILKKRVEDLESILDQNNLDKITPRPLHEENYSDCDTKEFIDRFVSNNLFLFNGERTKGPINSCFDQIIRLDNLRNDLLGENEHLMTLNKEQCDKINDLKSNNEQLEREKVAAMAAGRSSPLLLAPAISVSREEEVFADALEEDGRLGEYVAEKDVLEKELESLHSIHFTDLRDKEKKHQELTSKLIEIENKIAKITGFHEGAKTLNVPSNLPSIANVSPSRDSDSVTQGDEEKQMESIEIQGDSPSLQSELNESETSAKVIKLGNKELILTNYLKSNNRYLQNQLDYLYRILDVQEGSSISNEPQSPQKNTDFSSFYKTSLKKKKRKSHNDQNFLEKLQKNNDLLTRKLSQAHDRVDEVILDLKSQVSIRNRIEGGVAGDGERQNIPICKEVSDFIKNLELLNEQQKTSLDEKEKELQEMSVFPDEYQRLLSKYNNLLRDYTQLKRQTQHAADNQPSLSLQQAESSQADQATLLEPQTEVGKTTPVIMVETTCEQFLGGHDKEVLPNLRKELANIRVHKSLLETDNSELKAEIEALKNRLATSQEVISKQTHILMRSNGRSFKNENSENNSIKEKNRFEQNVNIDSSDRGEKREEGSEKMLHHGGSNTDSRDDDKEVSESQIVPEGCHVSSRMRIDRELTIPISACVPDHVWASLTDSHLHSEWNGAEREDESDGEKISELQKEALYLEIRRLRECLSSTRAELESYKAIEFSKRDFSSPGSCEDFTREEVDSLRRVRRQLERQVASLEYKLNERAKYERLGINYELLEARKLLHAKMREHTEKLAEWEHKSDEYEREVKHLKAKIRILEIDNEGLRSQVAMQLNSRKVYNNSGDKDLIKIMRNENLKLQNFLDILQKTTLSPKLSNDADDENSQKFEVVGGVDEKNHREDLLEDDGMDFKTKSYTQSSSCCQAFRE